MKKQIELIADGDELTANYEYYMYILPVFNNELDVVLVTKES